MKIQQIQPYYLAHKNISMNSKKQPITHYANKSIVGFGQQNKTENESFIDSIITEAKNGGKKIVTGIKQFKNAISNEFKRVSITTKQRFDDLITASNTPKNNVKQPKPITKTVKGEIIPQPDFSMDYENILNVLKTEDTISEKWLQKNKEVFASIGITNIGEDEKHIYHAMAVGMNDNRPFYIKEVENLWSEEKKQYIESIWQEYIYVNPPYVPMNPEKNILGLKALQKYGTVEDLRKLPGNYMISKDNAIMKEYAKLVGKVGELKDYTKLAANTNKQYSKYYNEETMEEIMKSLREILVNRSKAGELVNTSYPKYLEYERLSKHTNKTISQCAKDIMRRLEQDNPWLLE